MEDQDVGAPQSAAVSGVQYHEEDTTLRQLGLGLILKALSTADARTSRHMTYPESKLNVEIVMLHCVVALNVYFYC